MSTSSADSYSIGWITALPVERAAAVAMLDDRHEPPENFEQHPSDMNAYSWGRIGRHNIVIASLPNGVYGQTSATTTALNLLSSLPDIKVGLLVGIGGGIARPHLGHDIRLGDVAVSKPSGVTGGVIQYDLGKAKSDDQWEPKGTLNKPPPVLLNALSALEAEHWLAPSRIPEILEEMWKTRPQTKTAAKGRPGFVHQGFENDRLFSSMCIHLGGESCHGCSSSEEVRREQRDTTDPEIHYGIIASGNTLVKDAVFRDKIAEAGGTDCICVEMEAAGLMDRFPCLVVRGICDYADSHKNDRWHPYASATAAAFAKELLHYVPLKQLQDTPRAKTLQSISEAVQDIQYGMSQVFDQVVGLRDAVAGSYEKPHINQCLRDLCATDPHMDKKRLQDTKGGLIRDLYDWILQNEQFLQFLDDPNRNLLWIRGDPGKGKTMLMCGIIDELQGSLGHSVVYFFCQETDSNLNSAISVLRGIIFLLVSRQPSLLPYLQTEYDKQGQKLFQGNNVWVCLKDIFENMAQSSSWRDTVIMVDALDECISGRDELLDMIVQLGASAKIKWIVSSRNSRDIEEKIHGTEQRLQLQLELNQELISKAVELFIKRKTKGLAAAKRYNDRTESEVKTYLLENSSGTFLWVALVCAELAKVHEWDVMDTLRTFPPGLDDLYDRMLKRMSTEKSSEKCREILAIATLAYQPLHLAELKILARSTKDFRKQQLKVVVGLCGSFLTIRGDVVYFIHQSAKEYLLQDAAQHIFPSGIAHQHWDISSRSIEALMRMLTRNPYQIQHPGTLIDEISPPNPDPLVPIRYSCIFWVEHLKEAKPNAQHGHELADGGIVDTMIREKYLCWLECLSLIRAVPEGLKNVSTLRAVIKSEMAPGLSNLLRDADRFLRYFKVAVETAPLQIYTAALIFSPKNSYTRRIFHKDGPDWLSFNSPLSFNWDACLQTLEGHTGHIFPVVFSQDGDKLVSSSNHEVKIWDIAAGSCLQTFQLIPRATRYSSATRWPIGMAFSQNGIKIVFSSRQATEIWDTTTATYQQLGIQGDVRHAAFSVDTRYLALGVGHEVVKWDCIANACQQTLKGHSRNVEAVNFSPNGDGLASASCDSTVRIWLKNGSCQQILCGHSGTVTEVVFSHNSKKLASSSVDRTIRIWNRISGSCLQILQSHGDEISAIAFSLDGLVLASGCDDGTVKTWDLTTGTCMQIFQGHRGRVSALAFCPNYTRLISGSSDHTIKIWDYMAQTDPQSLGKHKDLVLCIRLSADQQKIVSGSSSMAVKIWSVLTGTCIHTCKGHGSVVYSVSFSPTGETIASGSGDCTLKIWDTVTGICLKTLEGHRGGIASVAFSPDSRKLVSGSFDKTARIWDTGSGACLQTLNAEGSLFRSVAFSYDGHRIASCHGDGEVRIWDGLTGDSLEIFEALGQAVHSVEFSPDDQRLATSSNSYAEPVCIWDIATGTCVQRLQDYAGKIEWIALSPDHQASSPETFVAKLPRWLLSKDSQWLVLDQMPFLWLPPEYRPTMLFTAGSVIAWGDCSGRVLAVDATDKRLFI